MTSQAEALKNEGNARKAAGDLPGALDSYRRALQARPDYVAALYNLGLTLRELQELEEAEACFRRVLDIEPGDVDALFNLAALLRRRLSFAEAEQIYRRALGLSPDNAHLWLMLGELGLARYTDESLRDAGECFRKAAGLRPDLGDAHFGLGQVREAEGRRSEALAAYQDALRLEPGNIGYCAALLTEKQHLCDWAGLEDLWAQARRHLVEQPTQPVHPFSVLSIPSTPAEQLLCARNFAQAIVRSVARDRSRLDFRFDRPPNRRRRIGYLSAEFHAHATAYLTAELFELHDRERFEIYGYSYGPDDSSPIRERLRRGFDRFVDIGSTSDAEAARAIHGDGIEILVDLKGYTFRARPEIVALRPAPVQVSYLGYPGTMGAPFIDYLVGDRFITPPADAAHYSEKLVVMPDSYQVNDRRRQVGALPSRRELGLPERGFVFCCFNQTYKILPEVFAVWMRIMSAVPGSVLWLLEWNAAVVHNLRREAGERGVDPARLVFSPLTSLESHLARMQVADLFLDTCPVNAHTTASEALWAGLPVLTCAQETFASRVAGSLLHAVGLPQLVTRSLPEYEALAVRLAGALGELAAVRARLAGSKQSAALFDTPRYVRHLEKAYEEMWCNHVSGVGPRRIQIEPLKKSVLGAKPAAAIQKLRTPHGLANEARRRREIVWNGAFFVHHSLAFVNRELTLALLDEPVFRERFELRIDHYGMPKFGPESDARFQALAHCMAATSRDDVGLTVRHCWPPNFAAPESGKLALILHWEFGSLPIRWRASIENAVDEVWVASKFVRDTFIASGVPSAKVFVVPLGVNPARFRPDVTPYDFSRNPLTRSLSPDTYKFLFVGGTIWRKGIDVLLDAYRRAFTAKDDVALIIKDFGAASFYVDPAGGSLIQKLLATPGTARIIYLTHDMTEEEIASLYAACDCLAHPYRGEGYGLPIAEAMACGKPTIVTGFGAALDFANDANSFLVPATLSYFDQKRVDDLDTVDFPFLAEPDGDALVELLRYAVTHRDQAKAKGTRAARDIAAGHTWNQAAQAALRRVTELAG